MTAEIKPGPCPFCGSVALVEFRREHLVGWVRDDGKPSDMRVYCRDDNACCFSGPFKSTKKQAIAAWNRVSAAVHGGKSDE